MLLPKIHAILEIGRYINGADGIVHLLVHDVQRDQHARHHRCHQDAHVGPKHLNRGASSQPNSPYDRGGIRNLAGRTRRRS